MRLDENQKRVFNEFRLQRKASKADVVKRVNLTHPAVTQIVRKLCEKGYLKEEDEKRRNDGKGKYAHSFWTSSVEMEEKNDRHAIKSTLPSHCEMGLRSPTNHFEKVVVWTYGTIVFKRGTKDEQFELAKRFEFRDAHDVVPLIYLEQQSSS